MGRAGRYFARGGEARGGRCVAERQGDRRAGGREAGGGEGTIASERVRDPGLFSGAIGGTGGTSLKDGPIVGSGTVPAEEMREWRGGNSTEKKAEDEQPRGVLGRAGENVQKQEAVGSQENGAGWRLVGLRGLVGVLARSTAAFDVLSD